VASIPRRAWIEIVLTITSAALALLTAVSSAWIEAVFGIDPDAGNGAVEWAIVAMLTGAAVAFAVSARSEWRRAATDGSRPGA